MHELTNSYPLALHVTVTGFILVSPAPLLLAALLPTLFLYAK